MTDVGNLGITCFSLDIIDISLAIEIKPFEGEFPELFLFGSHGLMVTRVLSASIVTQPHIVALVRQPEGRTKVLSMHEPAVGAVEDSMLEVNGVVAVVAARWFVEAASDAEGLEDVAVLSCYDVGLHWVTVVLTDLLGVHTQVEKKDPIQRMDTK